MQLPYSADLEIKHLSHLFDNMSESYKIFWFQAIVNKVIDGKTTISYDELINEMIADAWYMVSEYKLNLGPADTLENLIHYIFQTSDLKSSENKENIIVFLNACNDKELVKKKRTLTYNVPYRLQAPFIKNLKGKEWSVSVNTLVAKINQEQRLLYYIDQLSGIQSTIKVQQEWTEYIVKNQDIIRGWIQYNLLIYLQRRNPNVPGIVNKLYPPQKRKLEKVKKYWKLIIDIAPLHDIYAGEILTNQDISIDHFVPWSYVAHDELWNLHPTTKSANSSKSNSLPDWNKYFPLLSSMEYYSYQMMWQYDSVHSEFKKCQKEHINSNEVQMKLYRHGMEQQEFCYNLEEIILPIYKSAENMGFRNWVL